jgi:signal peptidase I
MERLSYSYDRGGSVGDWSEGLSNSFGGDRVEERVTDGTETGPAAMEAAAETPAADNDTGQVGRNKAMRPWTVSWALDFCVSVLVSAFIIFFLYQPVRVDGPSMQPVLQNEDRLIISKIAYRLGDIKRGDVVVFLYPHDHSKSYIKRVIAVGGDDLRIDDGRVYVNGKELKERYVPLRYEDERSLPETVIPPHEYWMMGDHRSISSDSRDFGPVERKLIYGKASFVYWPLDQMGVVR